MIKAVIFDLDGVLVRSDFYHTQAWKQASVAAGLPFNDSLAERLRGVGRLESAKIVVKNAGEHWSEEKIQLFAEEKNSIYVGLLQQVSQTDIVPGVKQLLQLLQKRKIPAAVASSSKNARMILDKTGLTPYFSVITDGNEITRTKPDSEIFRKTADALAIPYDSCLVVEDSADGVRAAYELGCPVAGIGSASRLPEVTYSLDETGNLADILETDPMEHLCARLRPIALKENLLSYGMYRVTVLTDCLFRIEKDIFTDEATQVAWYRDHPAVDFTHDMEDEILVVNTRKVTVSINTKNFDKSFVRISGGAPIKMDNAENLLGTCSTLDTNGEHLRENPSVCRYDRDHIPLDMGVCAKNGVAVLDDSKSLLLHENGMLSARTGGTDLYVFAYGHDYYGAVRALYGLCGRTPVVPRWALGNWWSRYHAYTQQEYLDLMDNFEEEKIPISVAVIDMDWHYVQLERDFDLREKGLDAAIYGGSDGWTGYTWNQNLFPNHEIFLQELHRRGMHTTLNLHPALGIRWYEKPYRKMAESMGMNPDDKYVIPFQIANDRFVRNYLQLLHHPLEEEGVDFWWIDWQQGKESGLEGLDPLWALNHYHYLDNAHRTGEGLILSRYAGIGSHRYPVGFSGDTHMDWEFLDYMPYFTATAANVGYGWWSHDIGGHHRGLRDEELYMRWLQFGVFSPINRIHCCPAEVTSKEPWTLSSPMRAMAEKWFQLRHRLVPYLYSASWINMKDGIPLIRPMYYEWPEEEAAYAADHQYMFGDLLVAPITERSADLGMAKKKVWLPEGEWTDVFTNHTYAGNRWINVFRDSGAMPVFAKSGTILPLDATVTNSCDKPNSLDIYIYSGKGSYILREEENEGIVFSVDNSSHNQLKVFISGNRRKIKYHVFFKNIEDGSCRLKINGKEVSAVTKHNRCLQVYLTLDAADCAEITVDCAPRDKPAVVRERVLQCFIRLPLDNFYKERQWEAAKACENTDDWSRWIDSLNLGSVGKEMMKERLYSICV